MILIACWELHNEVLFLDGWINLTIYIYNKVDMMTIYKIGSGIGMGGGVYLNGDFMFIYIYSERIFIWYQS